MNACGVSEQIKRMEKAKGERQMISKKRDRIAVLDFGSQYAHLIAKRLRQAGYWSEIASTASEKASLQDAKGIIFSGGPASVYDSNVPVFNKAILDLDIPILGLCYGHHLIAQSLGGKVEKAKVGEAGFAQFEVTEEGRKSPLLRGVENGQVWMSHGDEVTVIPQSFTVIGTTKDCAFAALQCKEKKRYSLQFHCEVRDTLCGNIILENFAHICGMEKNWSEDDVMNNIVEDIRLKANGRNVLLFLSGGVDSTVSFALLNKALGKNRVLGLHIDNGFMRKGESAAVSASYHAHGMDNFCTMDASDTFLKAIAGLTNPQDKRRAVGETFVKVRDEFVEKQSLTGEWMLAQGTLYPDIIESGGTNNSQTIKTHHNRVKGIQKLIDEGLVIEPLSDLYKDEVRRLGAKAGLAKEVIMRHPFPGPGLSINVLCTNGVLTAEDKSDIEKAKEEVDNAVIDMFCAKCTAGLVRSVLPVRSVGVQGDYRTYRFPAVLTFAASTDDIGYYHLPKKWEKLEAASNVITNGAKYINRTVLCLYKNPDVDDNAMQLQECYCSKENLDQLREADKIMLDTLHESGWYEKVFQHLTIRLPYASKRGRASFVLRPVVSEDVMTARFAPLPQEMLISVVKKIAALSFCDAVYFDITGKPPATFGWE